MKVLGLGVRLNSFVFYQGQTYMYTPGLGQYYRHLYRSHNTKNSIVCSNIHLSIDGNSNERIRKWLMITTITTRGRSLVSLRKAS